MSNERIVAVETERSIPLDRVRKLSERIAFQVGGEPGGYQSSDSLVEVRSELEAEEAPTTGAGDGPADTSAPKR